MDNETKQLLEELRDSLKHKQKPFYQSVLQSVLVAVLVAIPTVIITGLQISNNVENKIIAFERTQAEEKRELKQKERQIDYNFELLESVHPELHFIDINQK